MPTWRLTSTPRGSTARRKRTHGAVKSLDAPRLLAAFTGLERAGAAKPVRPALAAVLARLGQPSQASQALEDDLGRGLLDELAARQDRRLTAAERARVRELTSELEKLDKVVESTPKGLDEAQRAKRFEDLKHQRELASIALGEFQTKLVAVHKVLAGQVATLSEIQAALPSDAALVAWVEVSPAGPNAADPDGEHWGVVVRSARHSGVVALSGTWQGRPLDHERHRAREPSQVRAASTARCRRGRLDAAARSASGPEGSTPLTQCLA